MKTDEGPSPDDERFFFHGEGLVEGIKGFSATMTFTRRAAVRLALLLMSGLWNAAVAAAAPGDTPHLWVPKYHLGPRDLAVIVNDRDALSVRIGRYYQRRRAIPPANIIHVSFEPDRNVMPKEVFARVDSRVARLTPPGVQAYALTWLRPYRVACMSVTAAFAMGFDPGDCAEGCRPTKRSPYYDSDSVTPFDDYGIRPAMSIAAKDFADAKALIDRGIAADDTHPAGTGYLVETSDRVRNVRAVRYDAVRAALLGAVRLQHVRAPFIANKPDVLFYFIGAKKVPELTSNRFLPGAIADHLTSTGGELTGSSQMSSLRWLQAGATGSYGTVVEPCNFPAKFPDPGVVIYRYLAGETLVEAYWKSVQMPGQGVFIGEPLARPFGGFRVTRDRGRYVIRTRSLRPGAYAVLGAAQDVGPYALIAKGIQVVRGEQVVAFPDAHKHVYGLVDESAVTPGGLELGGVSVDLAPANALQGGAGRDAMAGRAGR